VNYTLEYVTNYPELWESSDPIRPHLRADFKTAPGRGVFGLRGKDGGWKAFMCYARTSAVPRNITELEKLTNKNSSIIIPYTVWSNEKGAGREIINQVLRMAQCVEYNITRVVTLSPLTLMARNFHIRNNAKELRMNETTVNFEYKVKQLEVYNSLI
jgi:hypothetical protein